METPLAAAAAVAEATNADRRTFTRLMGPLVGPEAQYASASIWSTDPVATKPVLVLGERPALESRSPADIRSVLDAAAHSQELTVLGVLDAPQPRIS